MSVGTARRWARRAGLGGLGLALLAFAGLEVARFTAQRAGVVEVDLPDPSEIRRRAQTADYTDAYEVEVRVEWSLDAGDFGMGRVVHRDDQEVVWEAGAPGLRFLASYHLGRGEPRVFTLSTAVFYESWVGRLYFFFVRPVHRRGVPFMVSWMFSAARAAPAR